MEINKLCDESDNVFLQRKKFIQRAKKKDSTLSESDLIKYSKIWANIRYKGCKYSPKIYHKIKSITNDLKRKIEDYIEEDSDSDS